MTAQSQRAMALVDYSSDNSPDDSSEPEGDDARPPPPKRCKGPDGGAAAMPPLPAAFHDLYASTVRHSVVDDPGLHQGRKRQTPHVPGRWPSHVYVEWHPTESQLDTLGQLLSLVEAEMGEGVTLHRFLASDLGAPLPLHISLSRPLSLRTAEKDAFLERLTQSVRAAGTGAFAVSPCGLAWYKSPDSDRTFLILRVAAGGSGSGSAAPARASTNPQLLALLGRCNAVSTLFGQPALYQGTCDEAVAVAFHVSIAWTFGVAGDEASLRAVELFRRRQFSGVPRWRVHVSGVKAKIGNVVTHIPLAEQGTWGDAGVGLAFV